MKWLIGMLTVCATICIVACDDGTTTGADNGVDADLPFWDNTAGGDTTADIDSAVSDDPTDQSDPTDPTDQTITPDDAVTDTTVTDETVSDTDTEQPDIDTAPAYKYCYRICPSGVADCVDQNAQAITDADNYTCDNGICVYKGCNNSTECETTFQSTDYGCNTDSGYDTPTCVQKCSVAGDCVSQYSPLPAYDDDNYACTGQGFCKYLGCNTDQECIDSMSSTGKIYGCFLNEALGAKFCEIRCSTYLDCGSASTPAYAPDRYTCENERCIYHGCDNAQQCIDSMGAGYDCREP
jgi:hypothetical protein